MKCPKCSCALEPWPWYDGGWKGVMCVNTDCNGRWWSASVDDALSFAARDAVDRALATMKFPDDAETEEEWEARRRQNDEP